MTSFAEADAELVARGPGRMVADLDRITALARLLGDPQLAYPSVHVTGTNGKGSVVRMVAALLAASGLSAGTYTSPHLQTIRERFTLAGRHISEEQFAALYSEVAPLAAMVDEGSADRVTFFEMLTAMAYWWFADVPVDVGVFEVGMGGLWDATNLVRGDVAVINRVDVDHRELGSSPVEVAREKAGIIKPGGRVVCAEQSEEVTAVIRDAVAAAGADLLVAGVDFEVVDRRVAVGGQLVSLRVGKRTVDEILLPLHGAHQADNAASALAALSALTGIDETDDDVVRQGFGAVVVPGRLEIVHRGPTVVLDGAHNPHGARACAAAVAESFELRNLVLVVACLDDKDIAGILAPFGALANHVVVTHAPSGRAASTERMLSVAGQVWNGTGVAVEAADTVAEALTLAEGLAGTGDAILVAGSLYTVGAARDVYLPPPEGDDDVVYEPDDLDEPEDQAAFEEALEDMIDRLDAPKRPES